MNFGFSEEQNMLREQVARFMQEDCTLAQVRKLTAVAAFDAPASALWQQMADLGWLGLTIDAEYGGLGLTWVDQLVVLEETARGLCPLPVLSQYLAASAIGRCGSDAQKQRWLPQLANGSVRMSLALYDDPNWIDPAAVTLRGERSNGSLLVCGTKPFVADALAATHFLLACHADDALQLIIVAADDALIAAQPVMDATKPTGSLTLDNLAVDEHHCIHMRLADLTYLTDCGALGVSAEMIGAAEAALAMTSNYATQRIQFGKPIGQYQGVKHRLADMYVDIESFKSLTYYAAWTVRDAPAELPRAASMAKAYASDAMAQLGIDCVGLHGAIGFTAEYDIQLYLKRSKWARVQYGDASFHYERVAALGGL